MAKTKADRIMEMAANVALSEIGAGPEITGFSDRDEARAALAALVDEAANAPADPALLALARFGAEVLRESDGFQFGLSGAAIHHIALGGAVLDHNDVGMPSLRPGIASAIGALLAPDGAASEGVTG